MCRIMRHKTHKNIDKTEMKKNVKRFTIISLIFISIICLHSFATNISMADRIVNDYNMRSELLKDTVKVDTVENNFIDKQKQLRLDLIDEVDKYMRKSFPTAPSNLAEILVDNGLKHDFDICFMMSQTTIETGYGTAGAGRPGSRKSLFGVCKRYESYEKAVDDYCKLVKNSYLGNRKTIYDLMRNYVNLEGYRYAGSRGYEQKLKRQYNIIKSNTNISQIQEELRKMS